MCVCRGGGGGGHGWQPWRGRTGSRHGPESAELPCDSLAGRRGGGRSGGEGVWGGYGLSLLRSLRPAAAMSGARGSPLRPGLRGGTGLWRAINSRWRPAPSASLPPSLSSPPPARRHFVSSSRRSPNPPPPLTPSAGPGAWHRPRPPYPLSGPQPPRCRSPHAAAPVAQGRAEPAVPVPAARSFAGALARPSCGLLGACAAAWCGQGEGPGRAE